MPLIPAQNLDASQAQNLKMLATWQQNMEVAVRDRAIYSLHPSLQQIHTLRRFRVAVDPLLKTLNKLMLFAAKNKYNDIALLLIEHSVAELGAEVNFRSDETIDPLTAELLTTSTGKARCSFLELLIYWDNFALFQTIGADKFDLTKYLKWDYTDSLAPRKPLFWLNMLCHWAIKHDAQDLLQLMLTKEPSAPAKNIISKYLEYSEHRAQQSAAAKVVALRRQQWFDGYIHAPISSYMWSRQNTDFASYSAILQREGVANAALCKRFDMFKSRTNACYFNFRFIISPAFFISMLIFLPHITKAMIDTDPKNQTQKDFATLLLPVMTIFALDSICMTMLMLTAVLLKACYGNQISILGGAEENILRSYQGNLLSSLLATSINQESARVEPTELENAAVEMRLV